MLKQILSVKHLAHRAAKTFYETLKNLRHFKNSQLFSNHQFNSISHCILEHWPSQVLCEGAKFAGTKYLFLS